MRNALVVMFVATLVVAVLVLLASNEALAYKQPLCPAADGGYVPPPPGINPDQGNGVSCTADYTNCPNGQVPCLVNSNSTITIKPELAPLFWGSYWNAPTKATRGQELVALQSLVNGPHLAAIEQYQVGTEGIGPARVSPVSYIDATSSPPPIPYWTAQNCPAIPPDNNTSCTAYYAHNEINAMIGQGHLPPPSHGANMVYVVFITPGLGDYNFAAQCDSNCGSAYEGINYTVVTTPPDDLIGMTHEVVEALTQNITVTKCTYLFGNGNPNQIADLCNCYGELQNGYPVGAYWSQVDNACVIPEGWPGLWAWKAGTWTEIANFPIRQVATSGSNLAVTNTSDDTMTFVYGSSSSWTYTGWQEGMISIAGSQSNPYIVNLGNAGSDIYGTNFTNDGYWSMGNVNNFTSGVYSGTYPLATDAFGNPYYYTTGDYWDNFGGPTDQIVATSNSSGSFVVAGLNFDHGGVNEAYPGSSWWGVAGPMTQLFGNPNSDLLAMTDSLFNIWTYPYYYYGGFEQGSAGDSWGVGGFGSSQNLWALTPNREVVWDDYQPWNAGGAWNRLPLTEAGRIVGATTVGSTPVMFALGCAPYNAGTCVTY